MSTGTRRAFLLTASAIAGAWLARVNPWREPAPVRVTTPERYPTGRVIVARIAPSTGALRIALEVRHGDDASGIVVDSTSLTSEGRLAILTADLPSPRWRAGTYEARVRVEGGEDGDPSSWRSPWRPIFALRAGPWLG